MSFVITTATRERSPRLPAWVEEFSQQVVCVAGVSDVALARCIQIHHALRRCDEGPRNIVIVDDDIVITPDEIRELASKCRPGAPVSAVYCPRGRPELRALATLPVAGQELQVAGLGACAVASSDLLELYNCSAPMQLSELSPAMRAVTWSGPHSSFGWLSEDYRLWMRLWSTTGARLRVLSLVVGHEDSEKVWWPGGSLPRKGA